MARLAFREVVTGSDAFCLAHLVGGRVASLPCGLEFLSIVHLGFWLASPGFRVELRVPPAPEDPALTPLYEPSPALCQLFWAVGSVITDCQVLLRPQRTQLLSVMWMKAFPSLPLSLPPSLPPSPSSPSSLSFVIFPVDIWLLTLLLMAFKPHGRDLLPQKRPWCFLLEPLGFTAYLAKSFLLGDDRNND